MKAGIRHKIWEKSRKMWKRKAERNEGGLKSRGEREPIGKQRWSNWDVAVTVFTLCR